MKQIPFYQGIKKKIIVSGPSIHENQWYKCVVYSDLESDTHTITAVAKGVKMPKPSDAPPCAPDIVTATFDFNMFQTKRLALGDNNLAVYDIQDYDDATPDSAYTLYKVYEARVIASDSYVNHLSYSDIEWVDTTQYEEGYLVGAFFVDGYIVLGDNESIEDSPNPNAKYLKINVEFEDSSSASQ